MADLIDRDALFLKQKAHADLFADSTVHDDIVRRDEATAALAEIINAPTVNRWIPVEDALPETTDTFLAIVEENGEREYVIATYARYTGHWIDKECRVLNGVTHFMYLPEPPEEVQE